MIEANLNVHSGRTSAPIFVATLFTSAFLLFWVQPMIGKMALPFLGGTPSIWNTCMVFFQVMLLAGYFYAHALGRWSNIRNQIVVHGAVLLLPLLFLPIQFAHGRLPPNDQSPSLWLLAQLSLSAGPVLFVVSATAPLLQKWFAGTSDASARDPYFLYVASNAGSLSALLAYPALMEPEFTVAQQGRLWAGAYGLLVAMLATSMVVAWRGASGKSNDIQSASGADTWRGQVPRAADRVYWILAAFVPSALMLAVTAYISTNLSTAPFLWVIPLAIYLLSFIVTFARRRLISQARLSRNVPVVLLLFFPFVAYEVAAPAGLNWFLLSGHLLLFFLIALLCHGILAESRPAVRYLTEFYLWLSVGGVLGGLFTAIIAPMIFNTVVEYPMLVVAASLLQARNFRSTGTSRDVRFDILRPLTLALLAVGIIAGLYVTRLDSDYSVLAGAHTILVAICYRFRERPLRFGLAFGVLVLTYSYAMPAYIESADMVHVERNFFGVKRVSIDRENRLRKLAHGDTLHGTQSTDPARAAEPLAYYDRSGPAGELFSTFTRDNSSRRVAVIGLGTGSMAAYAESGQHFTFYEIDPAVESIARTYFSFLKACRGTCDVVLGDGRLRLAEARDREYDVIMLDAFSSDSIPAHLLSREAVRLYLSKLEPDGILVFHISNRYLKLEPLVAALVDEAGLAALSWFDETGDLKTGKSSSRYVIAARRTGNFGNLADSKHWQELQRLPSIAPWTDDYSNILAVVRWR